MPRASRSQEAVEEIRQEILDMALTIIGEHGFDNLSMRNLAGRLNVSATTIYNYYSSKDELYLAVLTRGFEYMYEQMWQGYLSQEDPGLRLKAVLQAFVSFGLQYPNYYNIMFTFNVPKYHDYIGKPEEPIAYLEWKTAIRVAELLRLAIQEASKQSKCAPEFDVDNYMFYTLCTIHGIVSLYNSHIVEYVTEPDEGLVENIIARLINLSTNAFPGKNSD